jgi:hypothetical protein
VCVCIKLLNWDAKYEVKQSDCNVSELINFRSSASFRKEKRAGASVGTDTAGRLFRPARRRCTKRRMLSFGSK